ncbi:MAG: NAD(P)H-dependent glycerol-3-phosphate dehydrogenase [Actinomycetota bacterium]
MPGADVPDAIVVVGGGSWGQAFASLAAGRGARTRLVCRTAAQAARLRDTRRDHRYLPGRVLPDAVEVTHLDADGQLDGADVAVLAVPSRATADTIAWLTPRVAAGTGLLSLTKGLDPATGRRLSETWGAALPGCPFAVLTGPNHAEEVAAGQPAAAVVAGDEGLCRSVQAVLNGPRFRVYLNGDLLGVELAAAAKNVIAVAAGMSDGMGFGDNAKASLITRGLAEMTRLGVACGAQEATYRGLAGMGDLIATCTSRHSRNRMAGELLVEGLAASEVEGRLGQVAEGLPTVRNLLRLAGRAGVELPISEQVAAAAFDGRPAAACLEALMNRAPAVEE